MPSAGRPTGSSSSSICAPSGRELCDEHQARLEENPLRVLDCKQPACQAVVAGAPRQIDHLCDDCAAHLARVEAGLEALGIPYTIDSEPGARPRLLHPHHL